MSSRVSVVQTHLNASLVSWLSKKNIMESHTSWSFN